MLPPQAAVAIVHALDTDSVLLMRRSERDSDPWSGHWSFPGGRRDAADPGLMDTAIRELAEECGILLAPSHFAQRLPDAVARRRVGPFLGVAPFVFQVPGELPAVPDLVEAVEAIWVPLQTLRDPSRHVMSPVAGRSPEILFPAVMLKAVPLWGFTYRLITEWLGLLPADRAHASFQAASRMLDWLVQSGCRIEQAWSTGPWPHTAAVSGRIPAAILQDATAPGGAIPALNMLEVRPHLVRMIGLSFEEYLIHAR